MDSTKPERVAWYLAPMTPPKSKRVSAREQAAAALTLVALVFGAMVFEKPEAGGSLSLIYASLAGAIGAAAWQYMSGETKRPSGSAVPEVV